MSIILHIEASFHLGSKAAGWGAAVVGERGTRTISGPMAAAAATFADVQAVQCALQSAIARQMICFDDSVHLCLRSSAAAAILSWAFPTAQAKGIVRPKRISAAIKEFPALETLREDVHRMGLELTIIVVPNGVHSEVAHQAARGQMEAQRK